MLKKIILALAALLSVDAQAALKFQYRSDSASQSFYAAGYRDMAELYSNAGINLTTTAISGVFGGKFLDMTNTGTLTNVFAWPGGDNCPLSTNGWTVHLRLIPVHTGNPTAVAGLFTFGSSKDFNQGGLGGAGMRIDATSHFCPTGGKANTTGVGYFNGGCFAAPLTFVANQPTDIWWTWDGTATAGHSALWQAQNGATATQVDTLTAGAAQVAPSRASCAALTTMDVTQNFANSNQFNINEIELWDDAEVPSSYGTLAAFITPPGGVAYEGGNHTTLAANQVNNGTPFGPGPGSLTGTEISALAASTKIGVTANDGPGSYDGSDRWSDPGVAFVVNTQNYKANSTTNNRTGTYAAPATSVVQIGQTFGASSGLTGTYDGSDRWSCPTAANLLTVQSALKCNSTSASFNGTYDATNLTVGNVKHGVNFGALLALSGTYNGSDLWSDPGRDNVLSTVGSYLANGASLGGRWVSAPIAKVESGYSYGVLGSSLVGTDLSVDPGISVVVLGQDYYINSVHKIGTYVPAGNSPPAVSDVRSGIPFFIGGIGYVGTLAVPPANKVQLSYVYDGATTGTLTCNDPGTGNVASGIGYDIFSTHKVGTLTAITNYITQAMLVGQAPPSIAPVPLFVTQGDTALFSLRAVTGKTLAAFDLTGATFQSYLKAADGSVLALDNGHHAANGDQVNHKGQYTLSLSTVETAELALSPTKTSQLYQVVTTVTQGGTVTTFHGAILSVLPRGP